MVAAPLKFRSKHIGRADRVIERGTVRYPGGAAYRAILSWQHVATRYDIELVIDVDALAAFMASRAFATKSGVSKLQGGMIVARVVAKGKTTAMSAVGSYYPSGGGVEIIERSKVNEPLPVAGVA